MAPAKAPSAEGSGAPAGVNCKFFGSAKGCSQEFCPFSHDRPNSVPPCNFKQRLGHCDRGDACTFRHLPWASPEQAKAHYRSRDAGAVELSSKRYRELHRDDGESGQPKLAREHVEGIVAREMHVEAYGSTAVKMMERMGYKTGTGLGKDQQGDTKLVGPCMALERAAQSCVLGLGEYSGTARCTAAERAARLADARAKKRPRAGEAGFVQHNLLSSDESSDGEDKLVKSRDIQLSGL